MRFIGQPRSAMKHDAPPKLISYPSGSKMTAFHEPSFTNDPEEHWVQEK